MNVDPLKNSKIIESCNVENIESNVSNSNNKEDITLQKVNINEEENENSKGKEENSKEKRKNRKDSPNAEMEKKKEEIKDIKEIKKIDEEGKKNGDEEKGSIEKKKKIVNEKKKLVQEKTENLKGENIKKKEDNHDISKIMDYKKMPCNEEFLKKKRDKYKFAKDMFSEKYLEEMKKKKEKKKNYNKETCVKMENDKYILNKTNNNFMNKNKKLKNFSSIYERNDLNNIYIDNDFFNNNDKLGKRINEKTSLINSSDISKKKKFFMILCNGFLVVFLGVSNNICGRMRNRVLNNFDSLTASYNAIAYVTIYFILCIIYSKSKYIKKKHWYYIYPYIATFFKSKNKEDKKKGDLKNNYEIDLESDNSIKKKKNMKFYYIHKKRIYEPLLLEDENYMNCNFRSSFNNIGNSLKNDTYNMYNSCDSYSSKNKLKVKKLSLNKNMNEKVLIKNINKKTSLKSYSECNSINEEITDEVIHSFNEEDLKEIIGNYKFYEKKDRSNQMKCVLEKKKVQRIKLNNNDNKYKTQKNLISIKNKWRDLGAYKYIIIIALLDIISNTLYFVSQLAIPLTILLLLNQLNFIFSIILSYLILKRKYNIHHVISVIIVLIGFLFFYVPYIYKETVNTLKQHFVSYYMNQNFFINLNYIDDYNYYNNFNICNAPACVAPFGLIVSILFCVLSIFLTSLGGILRELFFSEYITKQQMNIDSKRIEDREIYGSSDSIELGSEKIYSHEMKDKQSSSEQINGDKKINENKMEIGKTAGAFFYRKKEEKKNKYLLDADIEVNKKNEYFSNNADNKVFKNKRSNIKYSNKLNSLNANKNKGKVPAYANTNCSYFDDDISYKSQSSTFTYNIKDKQIENSFPYEENIKEGKEDNNKVGKISVVLLSFNVSFIQILFLPLIIYFQLLFNKRGNISYFLYIKDSLRCFSGHVTENNNNCKYAFVVYALYIIINSLFNLSVSSFYSNYSSAECFLILKSSTPITLIVLYFFNFPFITDDDKYFSAYFVISIAVVFIGVSYFFYQNIIS